MKKILIFILLLSISKTFSQREHVISKSNIIKNKIEEVQIYNISTSKNYLFEHLYYDNFGNILKDIWFNKDGSIWFKFTYQYNEQQELVLLLDEIKNTITKYKYKYDKSGNRIESIAIKPDSTVLYQNKMIYNEKNQKIKTFSKKKNSDEFYLRENYFYANDGLCSKRQEFNETEKLTSTVEYEYDKNRILIFVYRVINGKKEITKFKYNKKGELIKVEVGTGVFRKYKYDKLGNIIEEITYNNKDKIVQHREYKYKVFE